MGDRSAARESPLAESICNLVSPGLWGAARQVAAASPPVNGVSLSNGGVALICTDLRCGGSRLSINTGGDDDDDDIRSVERRLLIE